MAGLWRGCRRLLARSPGAAQALTAGKGRGRAGPRPPLQLGTLCAPALGAQPLTAVIWGPIVTPRGKRGRSPASGGVGRFPGASGFRLLGGGVAAILPGSAGSRAPRASHWVEGSGPLWAQEICVSGAVLEPEG